MKFLKLNILVLLVAPLIVATMCQAQTKGKSGSMQDQMKSPARRVQASNGKMNGNGAYTSGSTGGTGVKPSETSDDDGGGDGGQSNGINVPKTPGQAPQSGATLTRPGIKSKSKPIGSAISTTGTGSTDEEVSENDASQDAPENPKLTYGNKLIPSQTGQQPGLRPQARPQQPFSGSTKTKWGSSSSTESDGGEENDGNNIDGLTSSKVTPGQPASSWRQPGSTKTKPAGFGVQPSSTIVGQAPQPLKPTGTSNEETTDDEESSSGEGPASEPSSSDASAPGRPGQPTAAILSSFRQRPSTGFSPAPGSIKGKQPAPKWNAPQPAPQSSTDESNEESPASLPRPTGPGQATLPYGSARPTGPASGQATLPFGSARPTGSVFGQPVQPGAAIGSSFRQRPGGSVQPTQPGSIKSKPSGSKWKAPQPASQTNQSEDEEKTSDGLSPGPSGPVAPAGPAYGRPAQPSISTRPTGPAFGQPGSTSGSSWRQKPGSSNQPGLGSQWNAPQPIPQSKEPISGEEESSEEGPSPGSSGPTRPSFGQSSQPSAPARPTIPAYGRPAQPSISTRPTGPAFGQPGSTSGSSWRQKPGSSNQPGLGPQWNAPQPIPQSKESTSGEDGSSEESSPSNPIRPSFGQPAQPSAPARPTGQAFGQPGSTSSSSWRQKPGSSNQPGLVPQWNAPQPIPQSKESTSGEDESSEEGLSPGSSGPTRPSFGQSSQPSAPARPTIPAYGQPAQPGKQPINGWKTQTGSTKTKPSAPKWQGLQPSKAVDGEETASEDETSSNSGSILSKPSSGQSSPNQLTPGGWRSPTQSSSIGATKSKPFQPGSQIKPGQPAFQRKPVAPAIPTLDEESPDKTGADDDDQTSSQPPSTSSTGYKRPGSANAIQTGGGVSTSGLGQPVQQEKTREGSADSAALLAASRTKPRKPSQISAENAASSVSSGGGEGGGGEDDNSGGGGEDEHNPAPEPYSFAFNVQNEEEGSQWSREETQDAQGNIVGFYHIMDRDGRLRRVDYTAGPDGFKAVIKSNEEGLANSDSADAKYEVEVAPLERQEAAAAAAQAKSSQSSGASAAPGQAPAVGAGYKAETSANDAEESGGEESEQQA